MAVPHWRSFAAEGLGAFFLVLAGGAAILSGGSAVAVALAFAFTVAVLVQALGPVSGGHFNPAISVAFAATGHFPWRLVPGYATSHLVGAVAASFALLAVYGDVDAAATAIRPSLDPWEAALVEVLATAMLAFVIAAVATDRRASSAVNGLSIGLAVGVGSLWAGPLTGGSMNPARSLGPAIAGLEWADLWLYLTAPFVGAVLGMLAFKALRAGSDPAAARLAQAGARDGGR